MIGYSSAKGFDTLEHPLDIQMCETDNLAKGKDVIQ